MEFKRYMVFGFSRWHPDGGLNDICGHFDDLESAEDCFAMLETMFGCIFDRVDGIVLVNRD